MQFHLSLYLIVVLGTWRGSYSLVNKILRDVDMYEPEREEKVPADMRAKQRLNSVCASAQSE